VGRPWSARGCPTRALRGSLERSIAEHRTILRAVAAGDAERAAHLLSEHIRVPQRRLEAGQDEEVFELPTIQATANEGRGVSETTEAEG